MGYRLQRDKKALYESQVPPLSIGGIGFSSHGKGLYAIDKKGEPVRNGLSHPIPGRWRLSKNGIAKV
jgi:sugar (pentulose or hexulose) kinase